MALELYGNYMYRVTHTEHVIDMIHQANPPEDSCAAAAPFLSMLSLTRSFSDTHACSRHTPRPATATQPTPGAAADSIRSTSTLSHLVSPKAAGRRAVARCSSPPLPRSRRVLRADPRFKSPDTCSRRIARVA